MVCGAILRAAVLSCLVGATWCAPAAAANRAGTARSQIVTPIAVTQVRDLNFGSVIKSTTAGTVTINAQTGARTRTGGAQVLGSVTSPSAAFQATGTAGRLFRLTLNAGTVTLNRVGGGATMNLNTLRVSHNGAAQQTAPRNFTLPASGVSNIAVGGRLNVGANQLDGLYSGTFDVTIDYQ